MGRGKALSSEEQRLILNAKKEQMSNREIARLLNRSPSVIDAFVKQPNGYGKKKSTGRPPKMTIKTTRLLFREASKIGKSSSKLVYDLDLPVTSRRARQLLSRSGQFKFQKRKGAPVLTNAHKEKRVSWAVDHVDMGQKWDDVVFNDEKKFNLDGPDGFKFYWRDLRKQPEIFSRRQMGGGNVMVWAAFSSKGQSALVTLEGTQDTSKYIQILQNSLIPFAQIVHPAGYVCQQDGASIHRAKWTKEWLDSQQIAIMDWPAKSPDLNSIENVWGKLARTVYDNGMQYGTKEELKKAIEDAWTNLDPNYLKQLVQTMKKRCIQVIERKGAVTDY